MEFKELIVAMGNELGFDGELNADDEGVIRIPVSGANCIAFMEVPEQRSLLMWCRIGEMPERNADRLQHELLKANFMGRIAGGSTLSLSEDDGIYLHRYLPLELTDTDILMEAVTTFVETFINWGRLIIEVGYAQDAPQDTPLSPPPSDNFIQV